MREQLKVNVAEYTRWLRGRNFKQGLEQLTKIARAGFLTRECYQAYACSSRDYMYYYVTKRDGTEPLL